MEKLETILFHLFKMTGLDLRKNDIVETTDLRKGLQLFVFLFECRNSISHCVAYIVWMKKDETLCHKEILGIDETSEIFFQSFIWKDDILHLCLAGKEFVFPQSHFQN